MRERKVIKTTLGELIVAVTDEVTTLIRDPSEAYTMVSCSLSDLLAHHRVGVHQASRRRYPSYLVEAFAQRETR
jgi:hypothetical protein